MAKLLVTGGCGFIGSHLVEHLLKLGHSVRVIDDLSTGKRENIPQEVELIVGSVTNKTLLKECLKGIEGCFHLAAVASVEKSIQQWSINHEINQTAIVYLFEEIHKLPKPIFVIYASSAAVYGNLSHFPLQEAERILPLSPYGVDKFSCELQAYVAYELYRIPTIGLRFFNVYGPRQDPNSPYSGVISIFSKKILNNEDISIFGDGLQQRDFIFVKDVVNAMIAAMNMPPEKPEVYNVCTGHSYSINQIAELIEEILNKKVKKNFLAPRKGDPILSLGDPSKLEKTFGLKPKLSLKEGLTELLNSLKKDKTV